MNSGEKFCSKDTKRPKDQTVTFEEHGVKAGGEKQKQGTAHEPCTQCHKRGSQSPKLPLPPVLWTHPYYHPTKGRSSPSQGASKQRNLLELLLPVSVVGAPIKPCLKRTKHQDQKVRGRLFRFIQ